MKKNLMSLAVAASVAGVTATSQAAMYLNPENTGQVLLFPFYNAEQGNQTSIHIVNTTGKGKAVKVRFMEYVNSQEVLDFNLYLSEYDHFSMSIFQDPNGTGGAIVTRDNSCTVPALGSANGDYSGSTTTNADGSITRIQPFVPWQYDVTGEAFDSVTRTLVGHVEVIEMGVLGSSNMGTDSDKSDDVTPNAWATHDATGTPADCAALGTAWASGAWATSTAVNTAITAPTGGLYGVSYHLNAADAAAFGIEAAAIADWATAANHTGPGSLLPSLTSGVKESLVPASGEYVKFNWGTDALAGVDAVSSLFQVSAIMNDVMINSDLNGLTDWVITFPTKRFYVNGADAPYAPFTKAYSKAKPTTSACEVVTINQWDREEAQTTPVNGFSPPPPGQTAKSICLETNTIAAGSSVSALNASVASATVAGTAVTLPFPYAEGWQKLGFTQTGHKMYPATITSALATSGNYSGTNSDLRALHGLPAMGFGAYKYVNGTVTAGALNNYGFTSDHKTETSGSAIS